MEQLSNRRVVGIDQMTQANVSREIVLQPLSALIITPDFAWPDQKTCYISLRIFSKNFNAAE